jgi:hypothetical protein
LRTSEEVAALGAIKEQKVVAGAESWSGLYWTARQTYMEFFGAAALPDQTAVGDCGIGLAVETKGGAAAVAERLRTVFGERVEIEKQVRTTANGNIPWYTSAQLREPQKAAMWVMELDPGYLAARHPEAPVKDPLSRQQERSWDYRADQALENVVGLILALNQERTSELATQLGLFGWSVHPIGSDVVAAGPDVNIRIVRAGAREGIKQVELRLHHSVAEQRVQLGNAELRLDGHTGQLIFWK